MSRIISIDSGLSGALASIDERSGELRFFADLPVCVRGSLKWINGGGLLSMLFRAREGEPARVVIEYMHALPEISSDERGRNVGGEFKKGTALGSILAIVQISQLPYELIVPQKWKRPLGLINSDWSYAEKKHASLDLARKLFPSAKLHRARDHNRAEAILIAHYAQRYAPKASGDLPFDSGKAA